MNLESRIKRLERTVKPDGDWCACADGVRAVFVGEDVAWRGGPDPNPGPETCPRCGLPRRTVTVAFVEADDWRPYDADEERSK